MKLYIVVVVALLFQIGTAKVIEEDVVRKVHGSYGPFKDFALEDCAKPHENTWMRCSNNEQEAFVYHWNNVLRECERKIYKGCGATRNNFLTETACNKQAKPVCTAPVTNTNNQKHVLKTSLRV